MCVEVHCKISFILVFTCGSSQEYGTYQFACSSGTAGRFIRSSCALVADYVAGIWFGSFHFKMIRFEWFVFIPFRCVSFGCARFWLWVKSYFQIAFGWCHFIFTAAGKRRGRELSTMFLKYLMWVKCLASLFKLNSGSSCNDFLVRWLCLICGLGKLLGGQFIGLIFEPIYWS